MRARFVLSEIGAGLRRNLTMTTAVIVTVAVSLALFGLALLVQDTVNRMNYYYFGKLQVSVFLKADVTEAQRQSIANQLTQDPLVKKVIYVSQQEALTRFKQEFAGEPALVQVAEQNPGALPESFRVQLKNPKQFATLASQFGTVPGVQEVADEGSVLNRIFSVLDGLRTSAIVIAAVQVVAAVLLIGNTIRLAAFSRRRETGIMRLVGASNVYIQLPFLLEGAVAGLCGGVLACLGLAAAKRYMFDGQLHLLFASSVIPNISWDRVVFYMPWLLLVGIGVSSLAAFVTLRRHLRV